MANDVFANGREISCKKADGKSMCAFPDVCFTPPENPATPPGVPLPYPNTGFASDTTDGSKTVKISGKEVMLKNKSYFKKSIGDEAGCAAKKGFVTSTHRGKVYFIAWSDDVKIEGENAVRHLDMTTHNHASPMANEAAPMVYVDRMALMEASTDCDTERGEINTHCRPWKEKARCPNFEGVAAAKRAKKGVSIKTAAGRKAQEVLDIAFEQYTSMIQENPCHRALRCALVEKGRGSGGGCCPPQTPDHLVPGAQFRRGSGGRRAGCTRYRYDRAPCICAEGGKSRASHGHLGTARRDYMDERGIPQDTTWPFSQSVDCGAQAAHESAPHCTKDCIASQLKEGHRPLGINDSTVIGTNQENVHGDMAGVNAELRGG